MNNLTSAQPSNDLNSQKWWVLLAIGTGTFMTALDTSVVNTILPVIRNSFSAEVATVEWVVTIYLLLLSGLLLSFGRLGDLYGHKAIYLMGFAIFVASSILCGLAPSIWILVACRALQALGAAMLAANSPAILTKTFPTSQRGQALGMQATMTYLGLTVGPSFGGWLATQFNWRYVFYINVPVSALAVWLSYRFIANDHKQVTERKTTDRFDFLGSAIFLVSLVSLLLGLNQGHVWGWTSGLTLGVLGIAAVSMYGFVILEKRLLVRKKTSPMLDLSLFRSARFNLAVISAVLNYICVYSIIFLIPFYLIQGRGLSPAETGLLLTAQPVIMAIVAPFSGTLSDRIGTRLPGTLGMACLAIGLFLLSKLGPTSTHIQIIVMLGIVGLGTGIFISPNNSALMGSAPRNHQGIAAGILATARNLGMVLGVGISGAIFTTLLTTTQITNSSNDAGLFTAIQVSFFTAGIIALLGMITSWARGG